MSETMHYIDPGVQKFSENSKEVQKSYAEACEWMSDLGIEYKKTRFGAYKKDIESLVSGNYSKIEDEDSKRKIRDFLNAHLEAVELIRIKTAFESTDTSQLVDNIKKMASGQKFRKDGPNDSSRSFAFELGVATRFLHAGYEVNLRSISDLEVIIDSRRLYVECKRLRSYSQLEKRVKEANTQIRRRVDKDNSSKSRGLIALNITDVITHDTGFIIEPSVDEYREKSAELMKDFVLSHTEKLSTKYHPKCLGIMTEFTTQGITTENGISFVNIREGNIFEYRLKQGERDFLSSFWPKLGDQNIYS